MSRSTRHCTGIGVNRSPPENLYSMRVQVWVRRRVLSTTQRRCLCVTCVEGKRKRKIGEERRMDKEKSKRKAEKDRHSGVARKG